MSHASAVESLLFAALEKPTAAERAAFLDSACAGDAELRRQVERLLKAHANVGDFLQKPVGEQLAAAPEPPDATQEVASTDGPGAVPAGRTGLYLARTESGGASDEAGSLDFLQPPTRPDSLGRLGHYEVLEVLGRGGFGIVFRAFDETLQRVVAIKVLAPEMAATSPARKRFLREARSSAKVRHENVVQVYAVEEEPLPYLVMEFVPGETLQQRIDRTGPLEVTEVVRIGRQIAEGLAAAHAQGLIHRDIKPANILIEAGPNQHVKITDFGLARAADDASLSQSGIVAGTPMFMAPEQASADTLDHRADLFSLGSVLYTMCGGRPPFRAPSTLAVLKRVVEDTPRPIREIIPEVPPWLCNLIARLHAKKPDDRFATAREVADLLGRGLAALQHSGCVEAPQVAAPAAVEKTPPTREIQAAPPALRPRFRIRRWLVAAAMLLVLLGGLSITEATGVTDVRGTVIRLFSPEGTLVVEVDDPGVSIKIDDSDLVITGAGVKEIRLKPGRYTVEASKDGKLVRRELVTVTKNGRQIVRVSQEAVPDAKQTGVGAPTTDPDRRAAEYVLSVGGTVGVNDRDEQIQAAADLPRESFRLTGLVLFDKQVTVAGLAVFKDCKNLTKLGLRRVNVADAGLAYFKDCKNLTDLDLSVTNVTDAGLAHLKDCKNLTNLYLWNAHKVGDAGLAHLKDCKNLTLLDLNATQVSDAGLTHLEDCKSLMQLSLNNTQVSDTGLARLKDFKNLKILDLYGCKHVSDAGLAQLKDCKSLQTLFLKTTNVTAAGIDELKKALPKCKIEWDGGVIEPRVGLAPFADADVQRIAVLPAAEQVEEVRKELVRRNPGFDGKVETKIEEDAATELKAVTDNVTDISPLVALARLRRLGLYASEPGKGKLADLSPLKGLKIVELDIGDNKDVTDLSALKGMPLKRLTLYQLGVTDLTPLKGMDLEFLMLWGWQGTDLTPLQGMPLKWLNCGGGGQKLDLTPLAGMKLDFLCINHTEVSDLTPLKDVPLTTLLCSNTPVSDLTPLRGRPLKHLEVFNTKVVDLSPLKGMPLVKLECHGSGVTDLSPLKGMQLEDIRLTPKNITQGLDILRGMQSLKTIGIDYVQAWPAAEFWERYGKGEFK